MSRGCHGDPAASRLKVVQPGGISAFKLTTFRSFTSIPRIRKMASRRDAIIRHGLCRAVYEIESRTRLHVHCQNLGVPGQPFASTIATIEAATVSRHIHARSEFHCYGTEGPLSVSSRAVGHSSAIRNIPTDDRRSGKIQFGQKNRPTFSVPTRMQPV